MKKMLTLQLCGCKGLVMVHHDGDELAFENESCEDCGQPIATTLLAEAVVPTMMIASAVLDDNGPASVEIQNPRVGGIAFDLDIPEPKAAA